MQNLLKSGLAVSVNCLLAAFITLTACGDSKAPVTPTASFTQEVPIDTIFTFDIIFGPDDVIVVSVYPEGCNTFEEIRIERESNRLVFSAFYEFLERCSPSQAHDAGADTIFGVDLEFERFTSPGEYFLVFTDPDAQTVSMPITVLRPSTISNVAFDPEPPDTLAAGDSLKFTYSYSTPVTSGVIVYAASYDEFGNNIFGRFCLAPVLPAGDGSGFGCVFAPPLGTIDTIYLNMEATTSPRRPVMVSVAVPAEFAFTPR